MLSLVCEKLSFVRHSKQVFVMNRKVFFLCSVK